MTEKRLNLFETNKSSKDNLLIRREYLVILFSPSSLGEVTGEHLVVPALQKYSTNFALDPNHAVPLSRKLKAGLGPAKSSDHNPRYSFDAASVISLTKTPIMGILTRHRLPKRCAYIDLGMITFLHFGFTICEVEILATTSHHESSNQSYKKPRAFFQCM